MHPRTTRARSLRFAAPAAALLLGLFPGCRSYERRPLDAAAVRAAMMERWPGGESAGRFAALLAEGGGDAGVFDPADGLSLAEAEAVALIYNRDLREARLAAGVSRAAAEHAGVWADPVIGVDLERILSGVPDPWVVAGTVGLTVPLSGRPAAEKAMARAGLDAELRHVAAREWETRTALRELWIEWSGAAHRARLAADLAERLGAVLSTAEGQERAGVLSRIEARALRVELAAREADLVAAEARAAELRLRLKDLMGLFPEAPVELVETMAFEPRSVEAPGALDGIGAGNAEVAAAASAYEVAERSLRLEIRKQYPELAIGPGFGTDEGDERILLGLQLSLPLWNRNRGGIAEALAAREAARGRFENVYEHALSRAAIARGRHEAGRRLRESIESGLLPLADEQSDEVRRIADLGRVDPLLLLQALEAQYEARVRLLEAREAEAAAAIGLDALLGPPVPPGARPATPATPDPSPTAKGGR